MEAIDLDSHDDNGGGGGDSGSMLRLGNVLERIKLLASGWMQRSEWLGSSACRTESRLSGSDQPCQCAQRILNTDDLSQIYVFISGTAKAVLTKVTVGGIRCCSHLSGVDPSGRRGSILSSATPGKQRLRCCPYT